MSHASLTATYRPQSFAEVAGQATIKAILSRAATEDRVAPAYLFSGTRGVGKTTIARIFAKALNCRQAPGPEPCNACDQCRAITQGMSIDVVEIDGASNRGIDDVRRLKEAVGYAPMEGRYKVFIIDEAHMLSREAFNALLKTLEEPPARVTFIMATTEPHKFPATIISRSQHFVFKRLSDAELAGHLKKVLKNENITFDEPALNLLVRRASGSVRDSMSLLGQVLALGGDKLNEADTRSVLGLAGQELFFDLLRNIKKSDCAALSGLVSEMLDQGLDLGFFLRELTLMWRNLFMLRQIGSAGAALVELPEADAARWLAEAQEMELSQIHAAWQMTVEGQRRVLTSLEPALALELLLMNLAMLPRLLSMEQLSLLSRRHPAQPEGSMAEKKTPLTENNHPAGDQYKDKAPAQNLQQQDTKANYPDSANTAQNARTAPAGQAAAGMHSAAPIMAEASGQPATSNNTDSLPPWLDEEPAANDIAVTPQKFPNAQEQAATHPTPEAQGNFTVTTAQPAAGFEQKNITASSIDHALEQKNDPGSSYTQDSPSNQHTPISAEDLAEDFHDMPGPGLLQPKTGKVGDWAGFLEFCTASDETPPSLLALLSKARVEWSDNRLQITPADNFMANRLENKNVADTLKALLHAFCGQLPELEVLPAPKVKYDKELIAETANNLPIVKALKEELGADFIDCGPWYR